MLQKISNFIKYNNTTAIIFTVIFSGMSISLATSPELRDSVYSSSETVSSIDNYLIISSDLDNFNFNLIINSVTENDKDYYIDYTYQTLAAQNGVWQEVPREKTLTVSKEFLAGRDLGLYVAKELGDNVNYELSYLKEVQGLQKNLGLSQKVVTVAYAGLIGRLLDPQERIIEGYEPVIQEVLTTPEPIPEPQPEVVQFSAETPITPQPLDEEAIRRIVERYLEENRSEINTPEPAAPAAPAAPIPEPTPEPQPEVSEPSAETEVPGPTPSTPETILDTTAAPESVTEPRPEVSEPSVETPTPDPVVTP